MHRDNSWVVIVLLVVGGLLFGACLGSSGGTATEGDEPVKVESIDGTDLHRLILVERATERLDLQTVQVREEIVEGAEGAEAAPRMLIPYASVLYDPSGRTWVYTNPEPLVYIREPIAIDYIEGDLAVLLAGPLPGTAVVTSGAAELYGTEFGTGK